MAKDGEAHGTTAAVEFRLCRRCHKYFEFSNEKDRLPACRYHPQTWAVRYHPEGRKYYSAVEENPKHDGWPGACWECCGQENRDAPGCNTGPHVTYDE